jgi:hypothetical protein
MMLTLLAYASKPGGFEGFVRLLEHLKARDPSVLDRVHERAPRDHFHPISSTQVGGVRDDDVGARLHEAVGFKFDLFEDQNSSWNVSTSSRPRQTPLSGPRERDQSTSASVCHKARAIGTSRRFDASIAFRTFSTFSSDIAYSESPAASRVSPKSPSA